jgi:dTDP-4-dehydrorhamnose reductase
MKKTILLIGASGAVGLPLYELFCLEKKYRVIGTYKEHKTHPDLVHLDVLDTAQLEKAMTSIKPDIILNMAGIKDVAVCENNPSVAVAQNVQTTLNLCTALIKHPHTKLIYLSTEYVFAPTTIWATSKTTLNPTTWYGKTKLMAEQLVQNLVRNSLVIRTSAVISRHSSLVQWFIKAGKNAQEVTAYTSMSFTPTPVTYLFECILNHLEDTSPSRRQTLLHVSGNQRFSRYNFLTLLNKVLFDGQISIKPEKHLQSTNALQSITLRNSSSNPPITNKSFRLHLQRSLQ